MQATQDASDIATGKYKDTKGFTQEKADAAYLEAKNAADLAVAKAKEAAGVTGDAAEGIWNKVPPPSSPFHFCSSFDPQNDCKFSGLLKAETPDFCASMLVIPYIGEGGKPLAARILVGVHTSKACMAECGAALHVPPQSDPLYAIQA